MPTRTAIARAAVDAAAARKWPLFTGNGFLCREVMALAVPGQAPVLPLHGGMGLAGGVAAGYLLARPRSGAIVLEGDGNHLMGWGCAQFIGDLGLPLVHVVSCNGLYRSTGGQRVPYPADTGHVHAAATVLNYRQAFTISTAEQLQSVLVEAMLMAGPSLLYVTEDLAEDAPPRSAYVTADYAQALAKTVTPTADSSGHSAPTPDRSGKGTQ
ncbi:thiamine pyrophosphate-dependent enzyme [Streptomyces sp. NPDC001840]